MHKPTIPAFLLAAAVALPSHAETCDARDASPFHLPPESPESTGDTFHAPLACRSDVRAFFTQQTNMTQNNWTNGFGWEEQAQCDLGRPFTRTMIGITALMYADANYPQTTADFSGDFLHWGGNYLLAYNARLNGKCGVNTGRIASTQYGPVVDNYTDLYVKFFFELTPGERGGTLVHETRHAQWKGHDAGNDCPRHGSCDPALDYSWTHGTPNSLQVSWLWWFYFRASRTTIAARQRAGGMAQAILNNGFRTNPNVTIPKYF